MCMASLEDKLKKLRENYKKLFHFISAGTLEIYIMNPPLISAASGLSFPLNILVAMFGIIFAGPLIHFVLEKILKFRRANASLS